MALITSNYLTTSNNKFVSAMNTLDTTPTFLGEDAALFTNHIHPLVRNEYIYFFSSATANSNIIKKVHSATLATTDVSFVSLGNDSNGDGAICLTEFNTILVASNSGIIYEIQEDDSYSVFLDLSAFFTGANIVGGGGICYVNEHIYLFSQSRLCYEINYHTKLYSNAFDPRWGSASAGILFTRFKLFVYNNTIFYIGANNPYGYFNIVTRVGNWLRPNDVNGASVREAKGVMIKNRIYMVSRVASVNYQVGYINCDTLAWVNLFTGTTGATVTPQCILLPNGLIQMVSGLAGLEASDEFILDPEDNSYSLGTVITNSLITSPYHQIDSQGHLWSGSARFRFSKSKTLGQFKTIYRY